MRRVFNQEQEISGITISAAAIRLSVSTQTVRLALRDGVLEEAGKRNRRVLIKEESLKNFSRKYHRPNR